MEGEFTSQIWTGVAMICAIVNWNMAKNKGRNKWGWGLLGLAFSFISTAVLYFMSDESEPTVAKAKVTYRSKN